MVCFYQQSTGIMGCAYQAGSGTATFTARGYSGQGDGLNNPQWNGVKGLGPLPQGGWRIGAESSRKGPVTLSLHPLPGQNSVFLSSREPNSFLIHGDNRRGNFSASEGCLILERGVREILARAKDAVLWVIE